MNTAIIPWLIIVAALFIFARWIYPYYTWLREMQQLIKEGNLNTAEDIRQHIEKELKDDSHS